MPHAVFGRAAHAGQSNGNRGDENNFAHGGHVVKIDDIAAAKGTAMKLARFQVSGRNSYGAVAGDGVVDLGPRLGERVGYARRPSEHLSDENEFRARQQCG